MISKRLSYFFMVMVFIGFALLIKGDYNGTGMYRGCIVGGSMIISSAIIALAIINRSNESK